MGTRNRVFLVVVLALAVLMVGQQSAVVFADGRTPEQKVRDAQGTAWRLGSPYDPEAKYHYELGVRYLQNGKWEEAQSFFEKSSAALIDRAVEESWQSGDPPEYIYTEATLGAVEREWSLEELRNRVAWSSNLEPQIIGEDGTIENKFLWDGEVKDWSRETTERVGRFTPVSKVIVHIDRRFMMKNLFIQADITIWHGSWPGFVHETIVEASTVVFWIPDSEGYPVRILIAATDSSGLKWLDHKYAPLGKIGPDSVVEVTVP